MGSKLLVKGGRLIDPKNGRDGRFDLLIDGNRVAAVDTAIEAEAEVFDAAGMLVVPGLIDMHVHLREPGREDEETIESGCRAAVKGGFTSIACMPNTSPVNDDASVTQYIIEEAGRVGLANVFPIAAITKGLAGEELSEMGALVSAGAVAFSDDGRCVDRASLMRRALEYSKIWNSVVVSHAEEGSLAAGGQMNEGFFSTSIGLKGIPAAAEEIIVARDCLLAELTGARLHVAHVSTPGSLAIIKAAKERGARVTCEVTPHHLTLSDDMLAGYDTNFKVNPPLRSSEEVSALRELVSDASIVDCLASDHAPHAAHEKEMEFAYAPCGMIGLETTLGVVNTDLVGKGVLDLNRAIELLAVGPARVLGLDRGSLGRGDIADVVIIDAESEVEVDPFSSESKSRNTPYGGRRLKGRVHAVLINGNLVVDDGAFIREEAEVSR
ncbi:MAG: dihydroorotase [Actinobacteria bacterium]|nr:dihydroorotase [Actinomycetota bacterium]